MSLDYDKDSGAEASDLGGRPTLYDPSFPDKVRSLARLGLTVTTKQLAFFFGVSERTVERWKVRFPEFCQSIREGRLHTDCLVAEKLFQRATGYEWVEEQVVPTREIVFQHIELSCSAPNPRPNVRFGSLADIKACISRCPLYP